MLKQGLPPGLATLLAMVLASAALLALIAPIDARYNAWSPYDELLFVRQAMAIVRGEWLGAYDQLTLAKGAGFALWLAAVHLLGVPVLLAAASMQAAACALAYAALRPLWPARRPRLLLFMALLFMPTALGEWSLMRELVYPAATLALWAAVVGWWLRRGAQAERRWALASGVMAAAVLLLREDALWLGPLGLPFVPALAGGVGRVWSLWRRQRSGHGVAGAAVPLRWQPLALAAAGLALPMVTVLALNRLHYGVATWVELNSRPFTQAYGALVRVQTPSPERPGAPMPAALPRPPQVPVTRAAWQDVARVVPGFRATERQLSGEVGSAALGPGIGAVGPLIAQNDSVRLWLSQQIGYDIPPGSGTEWLRRAYREDAQFHRRFVRWIGSPPVAEAFLSGAMDAEIAAWRFVWVLRDSAAAAGHHASATEAQAFYRALARDIDGNCRYQVLNCSAARSGLAPQLTEQHLRWWPWAFAQAVQALLTLEAHGTALPMGYLGKPEDRAAAAAFLHQRMAPAETRLPAVQPIEGLIVAWRAALPLLAVMGLVAWLGATPWRWRAASRQQRVAWVLAALCLVLLVARLGLLALVHVSSWPAATLVRYLAPAHPMLVLFIGLALGAAAQAWRDRPGRRVAPAEAPGTPRAKTAP